LGGGKRGDTSGACRSEEGNPRGFIVPDLGAAIAAKDDRGGRDLHQGKAQMIAAALPGRAGETEGR